MSARAILCPDKRAAPGPLARAGDIGAVSLPCGAACPARIAAGAIEEVAR